MFNRFCGTKKSTSSCVSFPRGHGSQSASARECPVQIMGRNTENESHGRRSCLNGTPGPYIYILFIFLFFGHGGCTKKGRPTCFETPRHDETDRSIDRKHVRGAEALEDRQCGRCCWGARWSWCWLVWLGRSGRMSENKRGGAGWMLQTKKR